MYNGYSKERMRTTAILKREYITTNNNKPCAQHLFLMLNVSTRSQLIEFELIKPTGILDRPGGRYELKIFSVCSQAVR